MPEEIADIKIIVIKEDGMVKSHTPLLYDAHFMSCCTFYGLCATDLDLYIILLLPVSTSRFSENTREK